MGTMGSDAVSARSFELPVGYRPRERRSRIYPATRKTMSGTMDFPEVPIAATPYARLSARRLAEDPQDPDALFVQAAVFAAVGRRTDAITILDTLARVAPEYPGLWRFKARMYHDLGDERMERLCLESAHRESL